MPTFVEHLDNAYCAQQLERILATHARIGTRGTIATGRVIPDAEDLAIHDGRLLQATVLFLDISRFTSITQETGAQQGDLLRCLSLFFNEMIVIVEDFGGVVEKNTGDGLMAYFTAEPGDEYSVQQRAVASALTMFHAADRWVNPLIETRGFAPFEFRICVDHGPITVARIGAARRFNGIVAIGSTANLACKMLHVATAGQLMIGDYVAEYLEESWRQFLVPSDHDTGFTKLSNGLPYRYWYYTGRWVSP